MSTPSDKAVRVSTLELFFDLVFVFTITQLTTVLYRRPTGRGLLEVVLMLGVIWWMYSGYAWLTNAVPPDRMSRRLWLLASMASYLVLALAVPQAFSGSGLTFGLAYLAIVCVHAGLFASSTSQNVVQATLVLARWNLASALIVLVGGAIGGTAQYVLWAAAFTLIWATPLFYDPGGFEIAPAHFVERHGLVMIVAIGESVVAVGIGAAGLPVDAGLVLVAVLGLLLSACLWWAFFGGDDARAERALAEAPPGRRAILAVNAFGYWQLVLLLGVISIAAGLKHATGHSGDTLPFAQALELAGGVAVYVAGSALFRRSLRIGTPGWRMLAGLVALATIPLGTGVAAVAQIAALVAVLGAALGLERAPERPRRRAPEPEIGSQSPFSQSDPADRISP